VRVDEPDQGLLLVVFDDVVPGENAGGAAGAAVAAGAAARAVTVTAVAVITVARRVFIGVVLPCCVDAEGARRRWRVGNG